MLQLLGSLGRRFYFFQFLLTALVVLSLLLCNTASVVAAQSITPTVASSSKTQPHATYNVTGTVFRDYNGNSTKDAREPGYPGITVSAYISATTLTQVASTTTDANGQYTLTLPAGTPARIEFSGLPTGVYDGLTNNSTTGSSTDTTFVDGTGDATINYAVSRPSQYCQNAANLNVVTTCFYQGTPSSNTGRPAVIEFNYNSSGTAGYNTLATAEQTGSTFGVVALPTPGPIHFYLTSAFFKRHAGLGPAGIGGIYIIDSSANTVSTFTTIPNAGVDPRNNGTDLTRDDPTTDFLHDSLSFNAPGTLSLGSMKLYTDPNTNTENVYVVNLADKNLYEIAISNATATPSAGTTTAYPIPTPNCVNGAWRPFAVSPYDNKVYVGGVCDASGDNAYTAPSTADLHAYIYAFTPGNTPGTGSFNNSPVFDFPLNYARGCSKNGTCNNNTNPQNGAYWRPWISTFPNDSQFEPGSYLFGTVPQPMLTSIAFDNGNMIVGFRDRFGDQMGYDAYSTDTTSTTLYRGTTAGDTLRICGSPTTGWTLESNASCGGFTNNSGVDTGQGPSSINGGAYTVPSGSAATTGAGEYYDKDNLNSYHDEVTTGSLMQVPGYNDVMATAFDPTGDLYTGGERRFYDDDTTGPSTAGTVASAFEYEIYNTQSNLATFGKANGLGDLVALCDQAPFEIGNRIWYDANDNGIQDPGEGPVAGVTVDLYYADANGDPDPTQSGGNPIATAVTDANGTYYFTNNPAFTGSTGSFVYVGQQLTNNHLVVALDNNANYGPGAPLDRTKWSLSLAHQGDGQDDTAQTVDGNSPLGQAPHIDFMAGMPGANNHNFDFGVAPINSPNSVKGLSVSQNNLTFSAKTNASSVAAQTINVSGENIVGGWAASISYGSSNQNWLTLSQTSGSLLGNNAQAVKVSANPTGLPDGTYQATIAFVANNDLTTKTTVNVTLNVGNVYTYYVPFVGNNANGYTSFVTLHNVSGGAANAQIQFFDKSGNALTTTAANACSNIAANAVCSPSNPFNAANGTAVIYSNQPLSVLVAETTPFGGTAYTVPAGAAAQLIAPLAINNAGGFNTQLSIFNGGNSVSQVTATFYDQQGNVLPAATQTLALAAHSSQTLDQSASSSNLPQGYYGWVKISGDSGSALVAQVLEENSNAKFVALLNAEANAQSKLFAPAIFKGAFGSFVTGANIVNPNSTSQQVAITYYDQSGQAYSAQTFTLVANAVQPVFQGSTSATGLPQGGLPSNFVGSAVISSVSGGGLVVAVNQAGGATASGTARSGTYLATAIANSNTIGLPIVANNSNGFTSGVTILNSSDASVSGYVQYYDANGNAVGAQHSFTIAAHASQLAYQGADSLPSGFSGEALVVQTSGAAGSLMATTNVQSNNVFYSYVEPVQ